MIPWRRKWQPTPVLLSGKFHGQTSLVGYSSRGCKESDKTEWLHFTSSFTIKVTTGFSPPWCNKTNAAHRGFHLSFPLFLWRIAIEPFKGHYKTINSNWSSLTKECLFPLTLANQAESGMGFWVILGTRWKLYLLPENILLSDKNR